MTTQKAGRIVTFYSYKGGTGRTMALSNVAWILASNGYDVLLIDWDLEAPGLHRYLRPFLIDPELARTPGLIDFVWDAAQVSMTPAEDDDRLMPPEFPSLKDYVVGLDWDFRGRGSISFIPAGQQDENYAQRVNTFNWDNFYERLGGGKLLHAERERLRTKYDYVLIDSRTGVSDTSSICTVQMPDVLAVFFTLNRQSIKGAAAVAASATAAVRADRNEALLVYPVPTRIENAETDRLDNAIRYARRVFAPFLMHVQSNRRVPDLDQQSRYWREVETPYVPFYAYEEVPAAFKDEPGSRRGLLAPNERIAYWITDQVVKAMAPQDEEARKRIVASYSFTSEETHDIERRLPTRRRHLVFDFFDKVRWQLKRRPWQYATIAIAVFGLALLVSIGTLTSKYYASELQSAWLSANSKTDLYRSAVQNAREALDRTVASLQQNRPPDSNQIARELTKIREELKNTP
ncbi:MinD-like ATPase involved in chromosome partitioning or flagellar assembly [Bradyrhizobium diazoefficiens]